MEIPSAQDVGGAHGVDLAVEIVVIPVRSLWDPFLNNPLAAALIDLVFCCDLFRIFPVAALVDHPAGGAVLPAHSSGDHVLVFAGVDDYQVHPIGPAVGLVDLRELEVGVHRVRGSLAGQRPLRVEGAEVIDGIGVVAAVYEGQGDHQLLPVALPDILKVHDPLYL